MSASLYNDKLITPDNNMLAHDLQESYAFLEEIKSYISDNYGEVKPDWKFYNKKSGWIMKLFNKKRNVLFVVPLQGYFKVVFTFGDKAADLVLNSSLPEQIKKDLFEAKKYAEGRSIHIEVRTEDDCKNILKLIDIKLAT